MSSFAKGNPFSLFFGTPFFVFFCFFLALQRLARLKCNLEQNCKHIWGSLFCSHTPARSVLDFESFAGRGQMLDGRVLEASQVEYNPFGKPLLAPRRRSPGWGPRKKKEFPRHSPTKMIAGLSFGAAEPLSIELWILTSQARKHLCRERHQLTGYQVDKHVIVPSKGEPSQVARTSANATEASRSVGKPAIKLWRSTSA